MSVLKEVFILNTFQSCYDFTYIIVSQSESLKYAVTNLISYKLLFYAASFLKARINHYFGKVILFFDSIQRGFSFHTY